MSSVAQSVAYPSRRMAAATRCTVPSVVPCSVGPVSTRLMGRRREERVN